MFNLRTPARSFSISCKRTRALPPSGLANALRRGAPIDVHPEVEEALASSKPLVALETAIVTHGLPYPANRDVSLSLERIVRSTGCVPATIGLVDGRVKIGLDAPQLERLAETSSKPVKLSRRDIAAAIATKQHGGTTITSTLIFAAMAGIKVVATGGLGGVHRGGENSMDVSADLPELSRCPVALVSAGVKSVLDIGRTLEYLETLGVPVVSYGKTKDFPAFYYPRSGFQSPWRVDDPKTAANILFTQWQLGMENGVFFPVPIPQKYEEVGASLKIIVEQAIAESEVTGINKKGNEATPWLLSRIAELSQGKSITSNIALIENAALVAGQISVEYCELANEQAARVDWQVRSKSGLVVPPSLAVKEHKKSIPLPPAKVLILGSAAVDISSRASTDLAISSSTSPGTISLSMGGVARNIAEACHRILNACSPDLQKATMLVSLIGKEPFGRLLLEEMQNLGMRTDGITQSDQCSTACCNMVLDVAGNLVHGVADMKIIETMEASTALGHIDRQGPMLVAVDGNLSPEALKVVIKGCIDRHIHTFFEPTSVAKSTSIFPAISAILGSVAPDRAPLWATSPNIIELTQMYTGAHNLMSHPSWWATIDGFSLGSQFRMDLEQLAKQPASEEDGAKGTLGFLVEKGVVHMAVSLLPFFQNIIVKCGDLGVVTVLRIPGPEVGKSQWAAQRSSTHGRCVIVWDKSPSRDMLIIKHSPALPLPKDAIPNVTGAGDSFVGSLLATSSRNPLAFRNPETLSEAIKCAQRVALLTLQSQFAVSPLLSSTADGPLLADTRQSVDTVD